MPGLSKVHMCGIVGLVSKKDTTLVADAVQALKDLEYRGYDSAGIGYIEAGHKSISIHKCLGAPSENLKPSEIYKHTKTKKGNETTIIGHTRWATHGRPLIKNAHPHTDCSHRFAIVHNGTILNHANLKRSLENRGHTFTSDTDSEVIAHGVEEALKHEKNVADAFLHTIKMLEGSFGIVLIDAKDPRVLYVAKNGSPLHIGMTNTSFIVASSVNVLLRHTKQYIPLSDKEFAVLSAQDNVLKQEIYSFKDAKKQMTKQLKTIKGASVNDLSKDEFETYMLKEIYEQPRTIEATLLGRYNKKQGDAVLGGLVDHHALLKKLAHIDTIACGTAHNAGKVGKEVIETLTDVQVTNHIASEYRYKKVNTPSDKTLVVTVSQSGETADTLQALQKARFEKYKTFGIVNVVGSAIAQATDTGEFTRAGTEVGVASTKAFTAQLAVMYLLALKIARARGMSANAGKHMIQCLERVPEHVEHVLKLDSDIKKIAQKFKKIKNISFMGRGEHVPIAEEAALKFRELTYMEVGAYPLGELKHGPMAIIDKDHLSVIIMPKDELFSLSKNSIEQIKSKKGKVFLITDESVKKDKILDIVDATIIIPTLKEPLLYPIVEIVPLQLFAYHFATALGKNVDKPRNLAKSVTVE
jgi:glucosamine--fructose-6-phosphate aminotransferase (isomerizing)